MANQQENKENESNPFGNGIQVGVIESQNRILNELYPCGDYGKNYVQAIYRYGHLGHLYCETGGNEKAIENLSECARLAKKYDALPEVYERTSPLFAGTTFMKDTTPKAHSETMCERMKNLILNKYPLSDEFKQGEQFKRIIESLS